MKGYCVNKYKERSIIINEGASNERIETENTKYNDLHLHFWRSKLTGKQEAG